MVYQIIIFYKYLKMENSQGFQEQSKVNGLKIIFNIQLLVKN